MPHSRLGGDERRRRRKGKIVQRGRVYRELLLRIGEEDVNSDT
jgi:hypothetical protein